MPNGRTDTFYVTGEELLVMLRELRSDLVIGQARNYENDLAIDLTVEDAIRHATRAPGVEFLVEEGRS